MWAARDANLPKLGRRSVGELLDDLKSWFALLIGCFMYVFIYIYTFVYLFIYSFIYLFIYLFIYSFMHIITYIHYVYIYIDMYVYVYISIHKTIHMFNDIWDLGWWSSMTNAWHQGSLVCWRPDGSEQIASPVCCSARTGMFQPWIPLTITKPGHFRSSQAHVKHELARNVVRTCSYPPAKRRGLLENLSCIYIYMYRRFPVAMLFTQG